MLSSLRPDNAERAALAIANRPAFGIPGAEPAVADQNRAGPGPVVGQGPAAVNDQTRAGPGPGAATQTAVPGPDQPSRGGLSDAAGTGAGAYRPATPKLDPMVQPAQYTRNSIPGSATAGGASPANDPQVQRTRAQQPPAVGGQPPIVDLPPIEGAPEVQVPNLSPNRDDLPPNIQPLPGTDGAISVPVLPGGAPGQEDQTAPGSDRSSSPDCADHAGKPARDDRSSHGADASWKSGDSPNSPRESRPGSAAAASIIVTRAPRFGTIDIEADEAVIWRGPSPKKGEPFVGPNGETWVDDARQPMEVYLEGNVVLRQDENKVAGKGDQRTIRAPRLYYDFLTDRMLAPNAEIDLFAPSLLAPVSDQIAPARAVSVAWCACPTGRTPSPSSPRSALEPAIMTGSRFPNPGYKITSRSIDLTRYSRPLTNPTTGKDSSTIPNDLNSTPEEIVWRVDARQNFYYMGPVPVFYWPHIVQRPRRPGAAASHVRLQHEQLLRTAIDDGLERLPAARASPAQMDRPLERRRRLLECPDQGLPGTRQRDGLVRHRSDPRPDRSVPSTIPSPRITSRRTTSGTSISGA